MLKVVGASWWQTRVSSYILGVMGVFAVLVLVLGELGSRVENDGIYSASVFWPSRYRVEFWGQSNILEDIPMGAARAYFNPDKESTGWSILEIETHGHYPDWKQAYAAGLLEGSLTWQMIYWHWQNTVEKMCEDREEACQLIRDFLQNNSDWIREVAAERSDSDAFWHQINLFYYQLDGLENGFNYAVKRSRQSVEISSVDFLWMNCDSDLLELMQKFNGSESSERPTISSSLVKLLWQRSDEPKVVVSQNTQGMYGKMLRMLKRYKFNYHITAARGSKSIPGKDIVFSGYPGSLSSQDDFYTISSSDKQHNLIVTGTTLNNYNKNLWKKLNYEEQVFIGPRVMAANRLASDGRMWSRYLYRGNSGTGNKQWQVLNLAKLRKLNIFEHHSMGLLWVVEQMPGIVHGTDQTHAFLKNTYWASFGLPHYKEISEASGIPSMKEKYGVMFSNEFSVLAKLFGVCKLNCSTLEDIEDFMKVRVPFSGAQTETRGDLSKNPEPSGIIDNKIVVGASEGFLNFKAYSGPLHNKNPSILENYIDSYIYHSENNILGNETFKAAPFKWSSSQFNDVNHFGQPDLWSFDSFVPKWVWI